MDIVFKYLRPWAEIASLFGLVAALAIAVGNMCWQSHLQNVKLRHDLFDRRFEIYRSLRGFIHKLMSNGSISRQDVEALTIHAMAAEFLFKPEIISFMNEAYHKALDLCEWQAQRTKRGREFSEPEEKSYHDTRQWFSTTATARLKELFLDDLKLS